MQRVLQIKKTSSWHQLQSGKYFIAAATATTTTITTTKGIEFLMCRAVFNSWLVDQ